MFSTQLHRITSKARLWVLAVLVLLYNYYYCQGTVRIPTYVLVNTY